MASLLMEPTVWWGKALLVTESFKDIIINDLRGMKGGARGSGIVQQGASSRLGVGSEKASVRR